MKLLKAFTAVVLVLSLMACQIPFGGSGGLKVVLPGSQAKNAKVGPTTPSSDSIRLQLTRNSVIVPLGGGDFLEKPIVASGSTVAIDGLAPGPGYVLSVSAGHRAEGETFYRTDLFQQSAPFEITAGVDSSVAVSLVASRITVLEATLNSAHGAATVSNSLYFLEGTDVVQMSGQSAPVSITSQPALTPGTLVNGLSSSNGVLLYNTTQGTWINSDGWLDWIKDSNNQHVSANVLESGSASIGGTTLSYYAGAGSTAGMRTSGEWGSLTDLFSLNPSLQNSLNGQVVRGFGDGSPNYLYLSTSIGTFRIDSDLLNNQVNGDINDLSTQLLNDQSLLLRATDASLPIGPISTYLNIGLNLAYTFAGTSKGLFADTVDATTGAPASSGGLPLVSGTRGLNITRLATSSTAGQGNAVYTAAYASNTRELIILDRLGVMQRISAFEGFPKGNLRLTWYADTSSYTLYVVITGEDATVEFPVGAFSPPS